MSITKEEIISNGYQILKDLNIDDYHKDTLPSVIKELIEIKKDVKVEGWVFSVDAPHCVFGDYKGFYAIEFHQNGNPHKISEANCGRGQRAFVYKDSNRNYKAVATYQEVPDEYKL